ncbi:MAG: hypothetical protein WCS88_00410 [Patescibacteria group bacterium]
MIKYLTIFINPLILLLGFWSLFYSQKAIHYWLIIIAILLILLSGRIVAKNKFWKFKVLWLNLIFVYISQLLFFLLLISGDLRYILSFVLSLSWVLIWWLIFKYFENTNNIESSNYLAVNKFFYYIGFWFLATSAYALVTFLHFPLLYTYLVLIIVTFFWALDIIRARDDLAWPYLLFSLFLLSQIMAVVYLLPLSFYVAGTIATLWFFFIIDNTANTLKSFRLYLSLFLLTVLLVLITAIL